MSRIGNILRRFGWCGSAIFLLGLRLAAAGGGPFGIDHTIAYDDQGVWKRSNQTLVQDLSAAAVLGCALWEGGEDRFGKTCWQAVDSSVIGSLSATAMKYIFTRSRPTQTDNPNEWFQGSHHYSFPSGEVTLVSAAVAPFVFEYGKEHPAVYALELLPVYDAIARVKVHAHWQSDVVAGFALGTSLGYYSNKRETPIILGVLPHGFMIGIRKEF